VDVGPRPAADIADAALAGPRRICATRDRRILLIPPEEIRYAEAAGHNVWLMTDQGRVRSATHGIEHLEQELVPLGFLRVHRSYIVNLARIREIRQHGNGVLTVSTHPRKPEAIPVSRRSVANLRRQLGL
jgi:DNA-binding LytR/AlgR family response regulator